VCMGATICAVRSCTYPAIANHICSFFFFLTEQIAGKKLCGCTQRSNLIREGDTRIFLQRFCPGMWQYSSRSGFCYLGSGLICCIVQDFAPGGSRSFVYWAIVFSVVGQGVAVIRLTYVTQVQCQMTEV
jgi:hypothetical protein